jgi:hypothetical protein
VSRRESPARRNLTIANGLIGFVLEVALLVAGFFWAFKTFAAPLGLILGLLIAALLVAFWTLLMAPKARLRIRWPAQPLVALLLFLLAGVALILVQAVVVGLLLMIFAAANTWLSFYLKRLG